MKHFLIFSLMVVFLSCKKDEVAENKTVDYAMLVARSACPNVSVNWLNDLLVKAEEDRTGAHQLQYRGKVGLVSFKSKTLFVVDFKQGSGGIMYYLYNCEGDYAVLTPNEQVELSTLIPKATIIYTNEPL